MEGLKASDVQIRATAPGMTATGGYVTIHNHSDEAARLVGVASDFAAKPEIHTMMHENGVMKMRALPDGIEIPAGGMVELAPGGLHLMLMGLTRTLQAGQMLEVELTFASGKTRRLSAHVKRPGKKFPQGVYQPMDAFGSPGWHWAEFTVLPSLNGRIHPLRKAGTG
ncbi:MAG: copper chaperone PCu(A)C [Rhodobiaceae bacterium]